MKSSYNMDMSNCNYAMMKKILSLLMILPMLFGVACTDDDVIIEPGDEQPEELPVNDVVNTTIDQTFAVIGSVANFDETGACLLNRLRGQQYILPATGFSLSDDVELVLMDNETLVNLEKEDIVGLRKAFDRGVTICLQKPHALAAAFMYMTMNGALEEAFKEENQTRLSATRADAGDGDADAAFFPYDMVCMKLGQEVIKLLDVYDSKEQSLTITDDESKETHNVTVTPREPTAYEYGIYAEDIAEWINETAVAKTRGSDIATRADETDNPIQNTTVVPCYIDPAAVFESHKGITIDADKREALKPRYTSGKVRIWTTVAYNFDKDEDYYHVIIEEEFNAKTDIYTKEMKLNKKWKATGFTFGGQDVYIRWTNGGGRLNLPLKDEWNRQPNNEGAITSKEEINGWSIGSSVSVGMAGPMVDFSASNTFSTGVTTTHKEVNHALNTNYNMGDYKDWTSWMYNIDGPKTDGGKVIEPAPGSPSIALCTSRQAWNWLVSDTKGAIKDDYIPLEFMEQIDFKAKYRIYASGSTPISGTVIINKDRGIKNVQLPVPARFSKSYSVVCSNILSDNWEKIEKQFNKSKAYNDLSMQYCAANELLLDDYMKTRWDKALSELKNMKLEMPDMNDESLAVKMMDNSGEQIGTTLYVNKHGVYTAQIGSYYMDDGTVFPNNVTFTEEQKEHCLGVVCILRDEETNFLTGPGNVGYVVALHDANDKPCAWGDCDNKRAQQMLRMLFAPGYLGSGYLQNENIKLYKFSSPAADYAMNYANTLPSKQGQWFMPTAKEMLRAIEKIPASAFEKAGGEAFDVNKKYATCSILFEEPYRGIYLEHTGNGWKENSDIELLKQEEFYVRPFLSF